MNPSSFSSRFRRPPILFAGVIVLMLVAALIWWATQRTGPLDKEIQRQLAGLRASGEPISADDLAQLFPNPSANEEASVLLSNALVFATNHSPPGATPIIMGWPAPARSAGLGEPITEQLRAYRKETQVIFEQMPVLWPATMRFAPHWERGMQTSSPPPFIKVRALIHLLTAHALIAAEDTEPQQTAEALERSFLFVNTLPSDLLVNHMIRQACAGLACSTAERCINRVSLTEEQLRRVEEAIPSGDTNHFVSALRGEHCLAIWAFQEMQKGSWLDDVMSQRGYRTRLSWWEAAMRRLKPRSLDYSDRDFLSYLAMYRPSLVALSLSPTQAVARVTQIQTAYSANVTSGIARGVPASWRTALRTHFECEARLAALKTALAVERFRLAHDGKLPQRLDELLPVYCSEVPRDLFDNQPLRFKILSRGYVIYSIGADGVDDGGIEKAPGLTNYDMTITVER